MAKTQRLTHLALGAILTGVLLTPIQAQAVLPDTIKNGSEENLGNYIADNNLADVGFTKLKDGTIVAVGMDSGVNGQVNVVDVKNKKNIWTKTLDNSGIERLAWGHAVLDNGNVLISTSKAELFEVNPNTQEIKNVSPPKSINPGQYFWELSKGSNNKVYVSSYDPVSGGNGHKGGKVLEYDGNTGQWRDYGIIEPGAAYVRSLGYDNGKVYAGMGSGVDKIGIYQIDAASGSKKKLPALPVYSQYKATTVEYLTAHNGYLYVNINEDADNQTFVFNTKTWSWEEPIKDSTRGTVVPSYNDKGSILYRGSNYSIYEYNPATKSKKVVFQSSTSPNRKNVSRLVDSSVVGGNMLVTFHKVGNFYLYDLDKGTTVDATNDDKKLVYPTERSLTVLDEGTENSLWLAPYFPTKKVRKIDPKLSASELNKNPDLVDYDHGQVQSFTSSGDWLISAFYPSATIVATNRKTGEVKPTVNIGNDQIRPQRVTKINDDLFAFSSDAAYGKYPGAISIYSLSQNKLLKVMKNFGDMSPRSISYNGGDYIYVGTSIEGGLGTTPKESDAKIFKVNYKTGQIAKTLTPGAKGVADMEFTPDGKLYALYNDGIARINPDTLSVEKYHKYSGSYGSMANELEYHNGYFIADMNGKVYHIDPKDLSTRDYIADGMVAEVADSTGDIYYLRDSKLYRWKISDKAGTTPKPSTPKEDPKPSTPKEDPKPSTPKDKPTTTKEDPKPSTPKSSDPKPSTPKSSTPKSSEPKYSTPKSSDPKPSTGSSNPEVPGESTKPSTSPSDGETTSTSEDVEVPSDSSTSNDPNITDGVVEPSDATSTSDSTSKSLDIPTSLDEDTETETTSASVSLEPEETETETTSSSVSDVESSDTTTSSEESEPSEEADSTTTSKKSSKETKAKDPLTSSGSSSLSQSGDKTGLPQSGSSSMSVPSQKGPVVATGGEVDDDSFITRIFNKIKEIF